MAETPTQLQQHLLQLAEEFERLGISWLKHDPEAYPLIALITRKAARLRLLAETCTFTVYEKAP